MITFGSWDKLGGKSKLTVAQMILTGVRSLDEFTPYWTTIKRFGDPLRAIRVLDFGCGMGRNIAGMLEYSQRWQIVGYDNQAMLDRAHDHIGVLNLERRGQLRLESDWLKVRDDRFDIVLASLVFQHIKEAELRKYLSDLHKMTDKLFVISRSTFDNGFNLWPTVLEWFGVRKVYADGFKVNGRHEDHQEAMLMPIKFE